MNTPRPPLEIRSVKEGDFLQERLAGAPQLRRLAVTVVLDLASKQPAHVAQQLAQAATGLRERVQAAFKRQLALASMGARPQAIATELSFAEVNRLPSSRQIDLIQEGKDAVVVSDAVVHQRRIAPAVQTALLEHCRHHASSMRTLAHRADAELDVLAALARHSDKRVRAGAIQNLSQHMRITDPGTAEQKAVIFAQLVADFQSEDGVYLVPVCRSPEQLKEMFDKTSRMVGDMGAYADNPYTPDSVLLEISSARTIRMLDPGSAQRALEALEARVQVREATNSCEDIAPS